MAQATLVPLEEYLRTSYSPDCEYVDGVVLERNVGDWLHSLVQSNLILVLRTKYPALKVVPELRAKVAEGRYRLPDVAVLLTAPTSTVLEQPPFIAIEILSADDSMTRVTEKLAEYAAMGAPNLRRSSRTSTVRDVSRTANTWPSLLCGHATKPRREGHRRDRCARALLSGLHGGGHRRRERCARVAMADR